MLEKKVRKGCKDIWGAYLTEGAYFSDNDIPYCPTTATEIPRKIITYTTAKKIFSQNTKHGSQNFFHNAYVCFYIDDYKFDSSRGIWNCPEKAYSVLSHFAGIITPDFSTNQDFPDPLKRFNTYRMRTFGYWCGKRGQKVINNARWGTEETFSYCFDGIPINSIVAIGTVASSLRSYSGMKIFNTGIKEMISRLHPHTILIYGSANYPIFKELQNKGIHIVTYPSETNLYFKRRCSHV